MSGPNHRRASNPSLQVRGQRVGKDILDWLAVSVDSVYRLLRHFGGLGSVAKSHSPSSWTPVADAVWASQARRI